MISLSNTLSFARAPLAFVFLIENTSLRIIAIVLAMITDSIDGYIARRSHRTTQFGAILDPAMDKFFVFFLLSVLLYEKTLLPWQAGAMLARDFSLCAFGVYLGISGKWSSHVVTSVRWSKITTAMQFIVLICVTLGMQLPWYVFTFFIFSGILSFIELFQIKNRKENN